MPRRARTLLACLSSVQMANRWRRRSRAFRAVQFLASFARRHQTIRMPRRRPMVPHRLVRHRLSRHAPA
jgi:hypothetical protein